MRVLICHNFYQLPGGEDQVFSQESQLLRKNGHEVIHFTLRNDAIREMNPVVVAAKTIWNSRSYRDLCEIIEDHKPDLVHFHNTFPLISPSAYYAARKYSLPIVQTLHNYRLLCLNAYLYRDHKVCEDCLRKRFKWPGVFRSCYRENRVASGVVALMVFLHSMIGTWGKVDKFIALTKFSKEKYIAGGLPEAKIVIKPNMVAPDPGESDEHKGYVLFAGRLSPEKGVETLLDSMRFLERVHLKIVGSGPLEEKIRNIVNQEKQNTIEYYEQLPRSELMHLMKEAYGLVFPSALYETFGLTIAEAFACGVPVIASNQGAMSELIRDGESGMLFEPGNAEDLARKIRWAFNHPEEIASMRTKARKQYEQNFTAETNYDLLLRIYKEAIWFAR